MTSGSARIFLPALREIEEHLTVPIPDRVRILSELEFDLEELWSRLVDQGVATEEAKNRALEALAPDQRTLRELGWLHAPTYRRMTLNIGEDKLRVVERTALAGVTGMVLLFQTLTLLRADLLKNPSPFLWPVLGLGALLLSTILAKSFEIWVKGDHTNPQGGLGLIGGLAGVIVAIGMGGTLVDLFFMASVLEAAPGQMGRLVPVWMVRECTLLAVSILLALCGTLMWFILTQWLTLVASDRREVLGLDAEPGL